MSICHWNLNSITAHNFSKFTQLKAYISAYKHDFICLSETYLDSSIPDNLIEIEGYNLVRADHPDNIKRGGVCIYYKESLPVRIKTIPYFKEALVLEMIHNNKKVLVSVIYLSPSQSNCEFESFLTNYDYLLSEINKCKPSLAWISSMVVKRYPFYRRIKIIFVNVRKWFFPINKRTNTYSNKQLFLYRFNFHQSTKFIC